MKTRETSQQRIERVSAVVLTRNELLRSGEDPRTITAGVRSTLLKRLRNGYYVSGEVWHRLWPDEQLLARVIATQRSLDREALFCGESAAVIMHVPLYRVLATRPQIFGEGPGRVSSTRTLDVRVGTTTAAECGTTAGLRHTGLMRTVLDLARFADSATALGAADAALRRILPVGPSRRPDEAAVGSWRAEMIGRLDEIGGRRGTRRARAVLEMADGAADSVAESVGKWRFRELGIAVKCQVAIAAPDGGVFYVDFELEGLGVLCEIDGRVKYEDTDMLRGRTPEQVFFEEKMREDWIRGATGCRVIRLVFADLVSAEALARKLRSFGIPLPR